ncbi:MAG: erythromycin esterase [Mycobacterium sp.]|nr:erythromycin esterase [Mycobacterium sp.]
MLGPVRVVGLGEATHGSREFVTLDRRLLAYLVTEQGFDVFAFEADHEGGKALDAGVTTGEGDPVGSDNLPPARDRLTSRRAGS